MPWLFPAAEAASAAAAATPGTPRWVATREAAMLWLCQEASAAKEEAAAAMRLPRCRGTAMAAGRNRPYRAESGSVVAGWAAADLRAATREEREVRTECKKTLLA